MMKFAAAFFSLFLASASANSVMHEMKDVKADSPLGMKLLGEARKLNDANYEFDNTWVAGYSLKFEGCHHISQWNDGTMIVFLSTAVFLLVFPIALTSPLLNLIA